MQEKIHRACLAIGAAGMVLALSACSTNHDDEAVAPVIQVPIAGQTPGQATDKSQLAFFDSDAFDSSLANVLSSGVKDVHITFAGTTSVNAMPPRINAWLAEVKKSDGQVTAKDPSGAATDSRSLLGLGMISDLIDLVTWYNQRKEREAQLATVNNYNATVMYDSKTGSLKELVFEQR